MQVCSFLPKSKKLPIIIDWRLLQAIGTIHSDSKYVPKSLTVPKSDLHKLEEFVKTSKRLFVISGAGLSTESGIPDYRYIIRRLKYG
jgi:hypothetical protein